jgi:hypothetical protein
LRTTVSRPSASRLLLIGVAVLSLAACGEANTDESTTTATTSLQPQRRLTVLLSTDGHQISPPYTGLGFPGVYTVTFANNDTSPHGLLIDGPGGKVDLGTVPPGKSISKEVDLDEAGTYTVYCPIDDHRDKGEEAVIARGA